MDLTAVEAAVMSLKTTNACPRIFNVFKATISKIVPNWEKMAYKDFFKSARNERND